MKRTPLNRVSKKRQATNAKRREFVREQISKRPHCEVRRFGLCTTYATALHEPLTRARAPGEDTILDVENSVAVCWHCHNWIHTHVAEATQAGWLKPSRSSNP